MSILDDVTKLAEEIVEAEGMELVHVELVTEGKRSILRIYIDKEGGVSIGDCTVISRQLAVELDMIDTIPNAYSLEVSSPGIDRILGKRKDFSRFAGENVRIKLKRPVDGHRKVSGVLKAFDAELDQVIIELEEGELRIPFNEISRANLNREIDL